MEDYRVNLDIYSGPLDLLLYLIRRDELDIHDIPIARITAQFVQYIDTIKMLNPDLAGEFLVMAATLLEIKTRMLLPSAPEEEAVEAADPRGELVRQLLEYKAFKDAAGDLRQSAEEQLLRYPRKPLPLPEDQGKDLEEVQIWDLVEAFNQLLASVGQSVKQREIIYDDTPIELHAEDIVDRLGREGNMTFRQIFTGRTRKSELLGLFLAMLELIRRRRIFIRQEKSFGEIHVFLRNQQEEAAAAQSQPLAASPDAGLSLSGQPSVSENPMPASSDLKSQMSETRPGAVDERAGHTGQAEKRMGEDDDRSGQTD